MQKKSRQDAQQVDRRPAWLLQELIHAQFSIACGSVYCATRAAALDKNASTRGRHPMTIVVACFLSETVKLDDARAQL